MLMARFCARVRKRADLPSVSIKDIYQHPTITQPGAPRSRRPARIRRPEAGPSPRCWPRSWASSRCRSTATSSTTWAPTPCSWPASAPGSASGRTCRRCRCKDIYQHPTITEPGDRARTRTPPAASASPPADSGGRRSRGAAERHTGEYVLCGALQLLIFLGYSCLTALVVTRGYEWVSAGSGLVEIYLRSVAVRRGDLPRPVHPSDPGQVGAHRPVEAPADPRLEPGVRPLLARQDPGPARTRWSLFAGSPLYALYLRALGAKIGRGAVILSRNVPVCTDLLTIGDGTVIRKDSFFTGYRAHAGVIQTGAVTHRQGRVRRRDDGARHRHRRWATVPSSGTPPRCTPGRPCPTVSAGTDPRRSGPRWTTGRSRPPACGTLRRVALRRPAAAEPAAAVPAAGHRRSWPCCSRRSRSSPRCWTRDLALDELDVLPRRLVISVVLFFGTHARRPRVRGHRSPRCSTSSSSRTRSTACTASTTGSTGDRPH